MAVNLDNNKSSVLSGLLDKHKIATKPFKFFETTKIKLSEKTLESADKLGFSKDPFDGKGAYVSLAWEAAKKYNIKFLKTASAPENFYYKAIDFTADKYGNYTGQNNNVLKEQGFEPPSTEGVLPNMIVNQHKNGTVKKELFDIFVPFVQPNSPMPEKKSTKKNKKKKSIGTIPDIFEYPVPMARCVLKHKKKMEFHLVAIGHIKQKDDLNTVEKIWSCCLYSLERKMYDVLSEQDSATSIKFFLDHFCESCKKAIASHPALKAKKG